MRVVSSIPGPSTRVDPRDRYQYSIQYQILVSNGKIVVSTKYYIVSYRIV